MQTADLRHKLHLYSKKIILLVMIVFSLHGVANAQKQKYRWVRRNNPNYDDRKLTYGFLIGLHTTAYQLKYSDKFVTPAMDTVYAVQPLWSPGFSLGFIMNYKLAELWDLRLTPKVAFYEHKLRYLFTDNTKTEEELVETTMVEFPLLLKFKSERRENLRMYMIGGIKPGIEASGKRGVKDVTTALDVKGTNLSLDFGFGFDIYYPLFKFSPEIRFSHGIVNVLDNSVNKYSIPLQRLNTNTITVYLLFQ